MRPWHDSQGTPTAKAVGLSCIPGLICVLDQQFGRKMCASARSLSSPPVSAPLVRHPDPDLVELRSVANLDANTQIFWVAVMAAAIVFTNF